MNTFGNLFRLTTFGESHGVAVGGVIDGMPAGIPVDEDFLQAEMARRKPGQSTLTTGRQESDHVELLSGVFEGKTTGTPIGFEVRNNNQHSADYENLRHLFRPSHADYTYTEKYGLRDHRGGGRSSARETLSRVVGGALAKMALREIGVTVQAYTSQVGSCCVPLPWHALDLSLTETNAVRCPHPDTAAAMERLIREVKAEGDTIGGLITGVIQGMPTGLGEPVAGKLHAALGAAMLSINACKGFDYGLGFEACTCRGSEVADTFVTPDDPRLTNSSPRLPLGNHSIALLANHSGGIQGGISNGAPVVFRAAFKPVATLLRPIETVTDTGEATQVQARGRHDPCVLPRAVPIVEAMAAMVVLDYYLLAKTSHL